MSELSDHRLRSLDGLRGIAILLVMGFHYFYAFTATDNHGGFYPYGSAFEGVAIFKYGYLGVELFFIISGFVIAMTLERCATPTEFAIRRFARIWPPLLVCSALTFLVVSAFDSPFSRSSHQIWANFLPSLTLTPANMWAWVSPDVRMIDVVYWSLIVEVRFYIIAGFLFYVFGKASFARNLVIFTCLNVLARAALKIALPGSESIYFMTLIPDFLPWLTAGTIFYELLRGRLTPNQALLYLAPIAALIIRSSAIDADPARSAWTISAIALAFFSVFWLVARGYRVANILCNRALVWVGLCSYSIYLLHFEIGMTLISAIPKATTLGMQILAVVSVAALVIFVSNLSFTFVERQGRFLVNAFVNRKNAAAAFGDVRQSAASRRPITPA